MILPWCFHLIPFAGLRHHRYLQRVAAVEHLRREVGGTSQTGGRQNRQRWRLQSSRILRPTRRGFLGKAVTHALSEWGLVLTSLPPPRSLNDATSTT